MDSKSFTSSASTVADQSIFHRIVKQTLRLCCLFFGLLPIFASAGEDILTLYYNALDADPALRSMQFESKVVDERLVQSRANFLPNFSAQAQFQDTQQEILRSDNAVYQQSKARFPTTNYSASLTQPVFHLDNIYAYDASELDVAKAKVDLNLSRQDLMVRLLEGYLSKLKADEDLDLAMAESDMLQVELKASRIKFGNGLIAIADLRDVEARVAEVEAMVASSQLAVTDSEGILASIVGRKVAEINALQKDAVLPNIMVNSVDNLVEQAWSNNAELSSLKLEVEMSAKEVKRQNAQHFPTLDLIARYNLENTEGSLFGGGSEVETKDVLLQLEVPIYSGGRVQSKTRESVYKLQQSRQNVEAKQRSVERDVRSGVVALQSSLNMIASLQKAVEAKNSLFELKREGYKSGVNAILDLLETQRDLYIAKRDLVAARYDHILNYMKFKKSLGDLADADIEAINSLFANAQVSLGRDANEQFVMLENEMPSENVSGTTD